MDFKRPIFEEPPEGLGEGDLHLGLLVVGMCGMEGVEVTQQHVGWIDENLILKS